MNYAYSNQQMRRADAATIAAGTSSMILMERAGQALARAVSDAMRRKGAAEAGAGGAEPRRPRGRARGI